VLNLKKALTKILNKITVRTVTCTYVQNSCVTSNLFTAPTKEVCGVVVANISFNVGTAPGTTWTTIGTIAKKPSRNIETIVPSQNNNGNVYLRITTDGNIQIYNASGTPSGWFRTTVTYVP